MLTYRIDKDKWNAGKVTDECNKLVQMVGTEPSNGSAKHHHEETEDILLPLDPRIILATSSEKLCFSDTNGGEDLQWCRKQNGNRVQELNSVDHLVVLRQVEQDNSFCVRTVGSIRDGTHANEEDCDDNHNDKKNPRKLLRVSHRFLDRNDKTNAFKGENRSSDEQGPVLLVEHDDIGDTVGVESQNIVVQKVS